MASKSKRARQAAAKAKTKSAWPVIIWALVAAYVGYLQNRYGQFSDIRGFYGMRFMDGQHHWPYDSYTPAGASSPLNPIEYPAITGIAIWLLTFLVPKSGNPIFNYFAINAFVNALLFAGTAYFIRKMTDNKHTYYYIFAPAVVMALNLNWDLWAMVPMLAAIYYFDQKKLNLSAVLLGLSIATKFFPLILLIPISIYMFREKKLISLIKYLALTSGTWLIFNLPVMILSFEGWKYFYEFSYTRGLGDGSIFNIFSKIGIHISFNNQIYLALNVISFTLLILFLFKNKDNIPLRSTAFFALLAFTFFGKQYSMQYILWLAPLAVLSISKSDDSKYGIVITSFAVWQLGEICFRTAYFQNMLTNYYLAKGQNNNIEISDVQFGVLGLLRYLSLVFFSIALVKMLKSSQGKPAFKKFNTN